MAEIIYKEEAFKILGAAYEVYNHFGSGFLEAVYQEALEIEFQTRGIPAVPQVPLRLSYKDQLLTQIYRPDFVAYDKIIVELKAIPRLSQTEDYQMINYLKATGYHLGLLLNFGAPDKLNYKRIVR